MGSLHFSCVILYCHVMILMMALSPDNMSKIWVSLPLLCLVSHVQALSIRDYAFHMEQKNTLTSEDWATCGVKDLNSRFDCDPGSVSSRSHCESKGCCWNPVVPISDSGVGRTINVPYCYFPTDYDHYRVMSVNPTKFGFSASLVRSSHSGWPNDVMELQLDVMFETQTRLHFKIYDPNNPRYEVPFNTPKVTKKADNPDYEVMLQKAPFGLKVTRKSTGAALFDSTMPGAPLIYADQFIQMSTHTGTGMLYGLGEHMTPLLLNYTWKQMSFWNHDVHPKFDASLYGTHPFYMNIEPDNKAHGVFMLNSNAMDVDLQPLPALTFRTIGGILDLYILSGPGTDGVISQYSEVIGRPYMPPYWGLGFHLCRWGYNSGKAMKEVIERNRAIGIPYEAQWGDIDYMDKSRDWTYDKTQYVELPDIVNDLHQHGQKFVIIVDPVISNQHAGKYKPYDEGLKDDVFIKDGITHKPIVGGSWPGLAVFSDFTQPKAADWWYRQADAFHQIIDYDGVWIDMNEPSNGYYGSVHGCSNDTYDNPPYTPGFADGGKLATTTLCPSALQHVSNHYNLHNTYGLFETMATRSALDRVLKKRSVLISRSTFPSQGHFGGHWTGDVFSKWQYMHYSIPAVLQFNMYGIPFIGADVCGFAGDTEEELCTRWVQLGAFYPFMRSHNDLTSRDQDPASFSPTAQHAMRLALETRYLLLPYLYTLYHLIHVNGGTVARPLFFNFPQEHLTYNIDRQFMWGDGLLISPVLDQGATTVKAYLPKAVWYNMFTNLPIRSPGQWVTLDTPLNVTNVHVRGGKIIPLQKPAVTTTQARLQPFYLFVALADDKTSSGNLFWDDGESIGSYENGIYNLLHFQVANGELTSSVKKYGYNTNMLLSSIAVYGVNEKPSVVRVNDQDVKYDYKQEVLMINDLTVDMKKPFSAQWK